MSDQTSGYLTRGTRPSRPVHQHEGWQVREHDGQLGQHYCAACGDHVRPVALSDEALTWRTITPADEAWERLEAAGMLAGPRLTPVETAALTVVRAWVVAGRAPRLHAEVRAGVRRRWPALSQAVEGLVQAARR